MNMIVCSVYFPGDRGAAYLPQLAVKQLIAYGRRNYIHFVIGPTYGMEKKHYQPKDLVAIQSRFKLFPPSLLPANSFVMGSEFPTPFENEILKDFQCATCIHYIFPPILQCINGHCHCYECLSKLRSCSQCPNHLVYSRNLLLEKIHSKLTFRCKHRRLGCFTAAKGSLIKEHEKFCDYSKRLCPLRDIEFCVWTGRQKHYIRHAKEAHRECIFFKPENAMVAIAFGHTHREIRCSYLIAAFDELFKFTWEVQYEKGVVRFALTNIRQPTGDKFSYKVSFFKNKIGMEAVSLSGQCEYQDISLTISEPNYLISNFDTLKDLCDINGDLHYMLRIHNNIGFDGRQKEHENKVYDERKLNRSTGKLSPFRKRSHSL